jgi:hypothetical protein
MEWFIENGEWDGLLRHLPVSFAPWFKQVDPPRETLFSQHFGDPRDGFLETASNFSSAFS